LIISESVARRAFGTTAVVGRSVISATGARRSIIGVARGSRQRGLTNEETDSIAFQPYVGSYRTPFITMVVSVTNPNVTAWPQLRRAVSEVDPSLVMFDTRRGEDGVRSNFGPETLTMHVALAFGALAVALAAVGLYATLARCLSERRREFGIRTALGATPARIATLVIREAGIVLPPGLVLGVLAGLALAHYLAGSLYGVSYLDVPSFAGAAALVTTVMAIASIPACLRASRVDATEALKES
jgi:predicted lysophospholipase L1 biosynthesis ABC-type transport system permease subunit